MSGASGAAARTGTTASTPFTPGNATAGEVALFPPVVTEPVRGLFPTVEAQLVGTAVAVVALLLAGELVRRSGEPLKGRFDDTLVEAAQAGTMTVLTALVAVFFVVVWRGGTVVVFAFDVLAFQKDDVATALFTVVILAGAYSLTRMSKRALKRFGRRHGGVSRHQRQIGHHVIQVGIYSIALIVVLALWGVNVAGLLVGAGFAGIVLGLAARQTLGSVIAGFVVLFSKPFELGDWVRIGDHEGVVTDIDIVNTQLRTFDDEFLMVPNDLVASEEVLNRSRKGRLRINVDVGVDYDADLEEAMDLAEATMNDQDLLLEQPAPEVVVPEFGDSAVLLRLRFYIDKPSARRMWAARTAVISEVKAAFEEGGVAIPFPQRELSARTSEATVDVTGTGAGTGAPPKADGGARPDGGTDTDGGMDADGSTKSETPGGRGGGDAG